MSVYDHRCGDCQVCPSCGKSAWCESDRILVVPCEHHGYCGDCNLTECPECRFREMTESGEYSADADPFYNPAGEAADAAYWASAPREVNPGTFRYPDRTTP